MTSRDFCFWLQGYFEITHGNASGPIGAAEAECIRKHLNLVFKHEIDPSMGPQEHQEKLNAVHAEPAKPATIAPVKPASQWMPPDFQGLRC